MAIIKNKKTTIDEIINPYIEIQQHYSKILKSINKDFKNLDKDKDTRIVSLKLIIEACQTNIILLNLVKENFGNLKLWDNHHFENNEERDKFLNDRLYFILGDLRESLFINIFLRFESFIKIISKSIGITGERINTVCKDLIDNTNVNTDYKNLIDLFTYSRNTIHTEGFHSRKTITVTYKGKSFEFKKDEPLLFYDIDFLAFMLSEIGNFIKDVIYSKTISKNLFIEHTYANLNFEYE
ncbi:MULTISPECIES: hypothetical protein [Flavobacterium]|uniref:hypothetical protein n=1 Tax=Flavobacterium TaxID=237 RepID=UPI0028085037|nr:hypothetical protein [Flavobacterium lindanitolerans]MDQ7960391.1 hypothetical protein [Flavobacterium lindanitolerans]